MRTVTPTVVDTIHVVALLAIAFLLFAQVILREEPAWGDFALQSLIVFTASVLLGRLVNWTGRRSRH